MIFINYNNFHYIYKKPKINQEQNSLSAQDDVVSS